MRTISRRKSYLWLVYSLYLNSLGRKGGPTSSRRFHATVDLNFRLTSHEPPSAVAALIVATIAIAIAGVLVYKSVPLHAGRL